MSQTVNMEPRQRADVWETRAWLWAALFYGTVGVSFLLALADGERTASAWVVSGLSAALLLWHGIGLRWASRDPGARQARAPARFVVLLGDVVLWFVLVNVSPAYYLALLGLFTQVFRHLPLRYAVTAAVLLTTATVGEQVINAGEPVTVTSPAIWLSVVAGLAAVGLGAWIWAIIAQSAQRRDLIDALEAAHQDLAAAERREGVLAERQRLAREIHDTLAQGFVSIILNLEAAAEADPGDPTAIRRHLAQAQSTARSSLDQARRVVDDLRPAQLERHSLHDAVRRAALKWSNETGIDVTSETTGNPVPQPLEDEVTLLRVAQEALNNVRTHAKATAVQVTLSYLDDVVILDVHDNGVGLAASQASPLSGGFGLESIRQRVTQRGGALTLESDPGEGTTLAVTIPLREPPSSPRTAVQTADDGEVRHA